MPSSRNICDPDVQDDDELVNQLIDKDCEAVEFETSTTVEPPLRWRQQTQAPGRWDFKAVRLPFFMGCIMVAVLWAVSSSPFRSSRKSAYPDGLVSYELTSETSDDGDGMVKTLEEVKEQAIKLDSMIDRLQDGFEFCGAYACTAESRCCHKDLCCRKHDTCCGEICCAAGSVCCPHIGNGTCFAMGTVCKGNGIEMPLPDTSSLLATR
eukprot:TRINITY_DN7825_c0_g1_i1.p1 TRINITY_DN7825_c0_g1~~TRINITY_DN7825_c0_g1_i1.p1  ORF type:complete len:209 (-),score=42.38 TRINITY_DN7825_c0_g1_i1:129-755(-)